MQHQQDFILTATPYTQHEFRILIFRKYLQLKTDLAIFCSSIPFIKRQLFDILQNT